MLYWRKAFLKKRLRFGAFNKSMFVNRVKNSPSRMTEQHRSKESNDSKISQDRYVHRMPHPLHTQTRITHSIAQINTHKYMRVYANIRVYV